MNLFRSIARFFIVPCDERPEPEPVYLPASYSDFSSGASGKDKRQRSLKRVVKEHKSQVTGEVIGYTLESGHYIVAKDAQDRHSEAIFNLMP